MSNHYKLSKWKAEVVARELAAKARVIIVNPSAPSAARRQNRRRPAGHCRFSEAQNAGLPRDRLNWVHVATVAIGHILAAEKGRIANATFWGNAEGTGRCSRRSPRSKRSQACPRQKCAFPIRRAGRRACE